MDWNKLRELVSNSRNAAFKAGVERGRSEALARDGYRELDAFIDECEAESKKNVVVLASPLPPDPPSDRRCRNCANFLWIPPETRETATKGKCYERNVGTEFCDAQSDLDHSWCEMWKPVEGEA